MLQRLPRDIINLKNLEILDVSYNWLLYLPPTLFFVNQSLRTLDISMNPFLSTDLHYTVGEYNVIPSLIELSSNILLNHRFVAVLFIIFIYAIFINFLRFQNIFS